MYRHGHIQQHRIQLHAPQMSSEQERCYHQGCVWGQHGRGQGQGSSRPRHNFVLEVSSRSRPVLEDPHTWVFLPCDATQRAVMPRRLSVHHSQIQRPTAASCALVYELWSIVFMVLRPLLTILKNSTSYGQISKPKSRPCIVEAKTKAKAKATKFCPRAVLEVEASPRGPHVDLPETFTHSRPIKLHDFGHVHRCSFWYKFLVGLQVSWACVIPHYNCTV